MENKEINIDEVLAKLVKIALFEDFDVTSENDKRILKAVYENTKIKNYKAGEVIIKEGDTGDEFYIDGNSIYKSSSSNKKYSKIQDGISGYSLENTFILKNGNKRY